MIFKKNIFKLFILLEILTLPLIGHAEYGGYIGVNAGLNHVYEQHLQQNGLKFANMEFKNNLKNAYVYGLVSGWKFQSGFQPELEISEAHNKLNQFSNRIYDGNGSTPALGSEKARQAFVNVWYDIPHIFGTDHIEPYVGAGLGIVHVKGEGIETKDGKFGNISDNAPGYQFGTGLHYSIIENLVSSFDIRYLRTSKIDFGDVKGLPPGHVTIKYNSVSLKLGVSYFF